MTDQEPQDPDAELLTELKRVGSSFRSLKWVKRIVALQLALLLIFGVGVYVVYQTQQTACRKDNELRTGERDLWQQAVIDNPIPPLPANATPVQIAAHDEQVKRTDRFIVVVNHNFAAKEC